VHAKSLTKTTCAFIIHIMCSSASTSPFSSQMDNPFLSTSNEINNVFCMGWYLMNLEYRSLIRIKIFVNILSKFKSVFRYFENNKYIFKISSNV